MTTAIGGLVCDRCGVANESRYRFCPECKLFVCPRCWEADGDRCLSCSRPNLPVPGLLPSTIRGTIGQRPLVASSDTRVGRALAGPGTETLVGTQPAAGARPRRPEPGGGWRRNLTTLVASLLLTAALFILPALSALLDDGATPSAPAVVVPTSSPAHSGRASSHLPVHRYLVRTGDTLRSIAAEVYGDERRWDDIYRANRATIGDPDALKVGSTLVIP